MNVTPHVVMTDSRHLSAIDGLTIRHPGYPMSQGFSKRIEEYFGLAKTIGSLRNSRFIRVLC